PLPPSAPADLTPPAPAWPLPRRRSRRHRRGLRGSAPRPPPTAPLAGRPRGGSARPRGGSTIRRAPDRQEDRQGRQALTLARAPRRARVPRRREIPDRERPASPASPAPARAAARPGHDAGRG